MKDEPLSDQDYDFIRRYGLICWMHAIKLPDPSTVCNGDRGTQPKCEANTRDDENLLQTSRG